MVTDAAAALTAGQAYTRTLEYFEDGGGATIQLGWESSSQTREIIPHTQLFQPGVTVPVSGGLTTDTRVVQYAYDGLERLTDVTDSRWGVWEYAYDDAGNRNCYKLSHCVTVV